MLGYVRGAVAGDRGAAQGPGCAGSDGNAHARVVVLS